MKKKNKFRKVKKEKTRSKNNNLVNLFIKDIKILIIIIFLFLVISIIYLINSVVLIYPNNNEIVYDRTPEFTWAGRYDFYMFYLSTDKNFANLIISDKVYETSYVLTEDLYFGDYYWKVVSIDNEREISSNVNKLRVESVVATEINETLKNVGNTLVDVEVLDKTGTITGAAVLDVNQELGVNNNSLYK